jgi:hypothetical protein
MSVTWEGERIGGSSVAFRWMISLAFRNALSTPLLEAFKPPAVEQIDFLPPHARQGSTVLSP